MLTVISLGVFITTNNDDLIRITFHTFPKGICPKVNVIARLEYELAYYDSAVHRFNHYTTRTPIHVWGRELILLPWIDFKLNFFQVQVNSQIFALKLVLKTQLLRGYVLYTYT